ncbi:hypothetical protein [Flavobacterium ardleyense]|uniref:hypothetical protein n=1 Tax=Flavobacterium ardleyense TaxID=2038737 RepID=UPI00298D3D8D|nr:hypothetical protein [Flavobacterium ardleyense]
MDLVFDNPDIPIINEESVMCYECGSVMNYTTSCTSKTFSTEMRDEETIHFLEYSDQDNLELYEKSSPYKSKVFYYSQINRFQQLIDQEFGEFIIEQSLNRLVFSGVVTAVETYLNEILIYTVFYSEDTINTFIENYEPYKKEVVPLNQIISMRKSINNKIKEDLNNLLYHNIPKMIRIFDIYNYDLRSFKEIPKLVSQIKLRHDFVHRSGIDKEDNLVLTSKQQILNLIELTNSFIEYINNKYKNNCFRTDADSPF